MLKRDIDNKQHDLDKNIEIKNELHNDLEFLLNFFQKHKDILFQHGEIVSFLQENQVEFQQVANKIGGGGN